MGKKNEAQTKNKAHYHYIKAKLYRFVSITFAVAGLLLFFIFSLLLIDNDPKILMSQPWIVLLMVLPFLPAYVLSMIAEKHRKKLKQLVEKKSEG